MQKSCAIVIKEIHYRNGAKAKNAQQRRTRKGSKEQRGTTMYTQKEKGMMDKERGKRDRG